MVTGETGGMGRAIAGWVAGDGFDVAWLMSATQSRPTQPLARLRFVV
jgi:NAD(P)-dependent dehydrogenase (short-subunit alcohol dehydrogenase family)